MNDKVTEQLLALLGDDYTPEIQQQIEQSILESNIASIKNKAAKITKKSVYQLWKEKATPEEIEAQKQASKEYYEKHKEVWQERYKDTVKRYQETNKEQLQEYRKNYYKEYRKYNKSNSSAKSDAKREKDKAYSKEHYAANKDAIIEANKAYYQANKDYILERQRQRYHENKERVKQLKDWERETLENLKRMAKDKLYKEGDEFRTDNF